MMISSIQQPGAHQTKFVSEMTHLTLAVLSVIFFSAYVLLYFTRFCYN